jgi:hypothetical protein
MDTKALVLVGLIIAVAGSPSSRSRHAIAGQEAAEDGNVAASGAGWLAGRLWGEVYSSVVAEQSLQYDVIGDVFVKQGLHLFKTDSQQLDVYAKTRLNVDVDGRYYYNRWEAGMGLRYRPFAGYGLYAYVEGLLNAYLGRELPDEPNPYDSWTVSLQGGLTFWQWWGRQPWQIDGPEFYFPFTGWRELYADAIYYGNTDNFIATLDYKEGLMLFPAGPLLFDAYIATELGADVHGDPWYHFAKIGPGFRVKPFSKLDLKISAEYFMGRYTKGGFGNTDAGIADFKFTIALWHGW